MRLRLYLLALLVTASCHTSLAQPSASTEPFDLVIRNGTVYDGSGTPPLRLDIGIRGDSIAAIGRLRSASARQVIDASNRAVAPGFINVLSWAATALIHDGRSMSDVKQGVTLEVFGEGHSLGPLNADMKEEIEAEQSDIRYDVTWTTLDEGLQHLVDRGVATNVASFVGATTVREHVLGYDDVDPTPEQLDRMRELVRQAMEDGAMGLGSSLIYVPASFAETEELIALAEVVGEYDGLYISHMRDEGDRLIEAVDELIRIAREGKVRAEIYHLKASRPHNWPKMDSVLAMIEDARGDGLAITADMYTYPASSTGLTIALPGWAREGGHVAMIARLQNPGTRARILDELSMIAADKTLLVNFRNPDLRPLIGQTLAEVADERGVTAGDALLDLIVEDDSRVGVVYFTMSEENLRKQIRRPWVSFGSDGASMAAEGVFIQNSTHPRAYGNFARLLGRYVREEKVIPLEEAVRRLTLLPAENLRLERRGRLTVGHFADVVVFDPEAIHDHATFERPHQYATGVDHVLVNGDLVLFEGRHTGALPGRVVRGPGWTGRQETRWIDRHASRSDNAEAAAQAQGPDGYGRDSVTRNEEKMDAPRDLESRLRAITERFVDAVIAVAVIDPSTGTSVSIHGDRVFHAASTMKVAVMIEAFRQAEEGTLSLDDSLLVENRFRSIVDGSIYSIEDDSDDVIYGRLGTRMSIGDLVEQMITVSSNLATNLLIDRFGADAVQQTIEKMGVRNMRVLRGVEDLRAYERGMNNVATADDLALQLEAIRTGTAVSTGAAAEMRDVLLRQRFNEMIPAGLPEGARVAHKTGFITGIDHDAAIVYPEMGESYVLVVLTEGFENAAESRRAGAEIARVVHEALR